MTTRSMTSFAFFLALLLGAGSMVLGCGADRHLHPNTGRAFDRILKVQTTPRPPGVEKRPRKTMPAEQAEIVMTNFRKRSSVSSVQRPTSNRLLLPLQR